MEYYWQMLWYSDENVDVEKKNSVIVVDKLNVLRLVDSIIEHRLIHFLIHVDQYRVKTNKVDEILD